MPKLYTDASEQARPIAGKLLTDNHGDVDDLSPDIGYFFIEYDADTLEAAGKKQRELPPVLKLHGVACAATIHINSYKDRVQGKPDVTVTINKEAWESYTDEQRTALLDHELTHLVVKTDKDGKPTADDLGRPCFKMRPHDYDLSIFGEVVRRHGKAAIEVKTTLHFLTEETGQLIMDWGGIKALPEKARDSKDDVEPLNDAIKRPPLSREVLKVTRNLCPTGAGSVTISTAGHKDVVLTAETRKRLDAQLNQ